MGRQIIGQDMRYLPFERFTRKYLLRERTQNLLYWFLAELPFCLALLWIAERRDFRTMLADYGLLIFLGVAAINGNVVTLLYMSSQIRKLSPYLQEVIGGNSGAFAKCFDLIYDTRPILASSLGITTLGYATFAFLGLRMPVASQLIVFAGIFFVFAFLGMTIGLLLNLWRFFFFLGGLEIKVEPVHPDRMCGLKPLGDLNSSILYLGAGLISVYSLGAHYSPYARVDLRPYAYLWIIGALILFVVGLIFPTYRIHNVLLHAKETQQTRISHLKNILLARFEQTLEGRVTPGQHFQELGTAIETLVYYERHAEQMLTWPYESVASTLLRLVSIQGAASIVSHWSEITAVVGGLLR